MATGPHDHEESKVEAGHDGSQSTTSHEDGETVPVDTGTWHDGDVGPQELVDHDEGGGEQGQEAIDQGDGVADLLELKAPLDGDTHELAL